VQEASRKIFFESFPVGMAGAGKPAPILRMLKSPLDDIFLCMKHTLAFDK